MRRLIATMRCDITLQARHGFYYATAFVLIICVALSSQVSALDLKWLLPPLVLGNLLMNTFYFIGGLILLEKSEGALEAQVVTPLRTWEYLASKVCTLMLLSLVENLVIVFLVAGSAFNLPLLATSIVLTSVIYCLAGILVVVRYDSINEYLMPSVLYTSILSAPLASYLVRWEFPLFYLHPLYATLLLAQAAFQPLSGWKTAYGTLYSLLWGGLLAAFSGRAFRRFITERMSAK
jgi:fluoroquinolone transport system permease protein